MKYVNWEIVPGVNIPMMEDQNGQLWGTNKTVAGMLGISESGVRDIYCDNKEEFEAVSVANSDANNCVANGNAIESVANGNALRSVANCVANSDAISFFREHKALFGIKRLYKTMKIWSDDDILTFCYKATGLKSIEIRRKFTKFLKEHSRKSMITEEMYLAQQQEIEALKAQVSKIDVLEGTLKHMWKAKGFEASAGSYELHAAKHWKKAQAAKS